MPFVLMSACKDLRRFRRDLPALLCWVLLPLAFGGVTALVFGRGEIAAHGVLLIADEDKGVAGMFVRELIARSALAKTVAVQQTDARAGRAQLDRGRASALLIIPRGFDGAVARRQRAELIVVKNPEERVVPELAEELAAVVADGAWWLQRGALVHGLPYVVPPRIGVKTTVVAPPQKAGSIASLLFPGNVFLVILIVAQGLCVDVWKERRAGSVYRLVSTRASVLALLGGKVIATAVVFIVAIAASFAFAMLFFDVPVATPVTAILWAAACASTLYLGLVVIQLLVANERTALVVGSAVTMPLAMIGGSFFPVEIMPDAFAALARSVPNGWMLHQFRWTVADGIVPSFGALLVAAAVLYVAAGRRMVWRLAR